MRKDDRKSGTAPDGAERKGCMREKQIIIRNIDAIENYLKLDIRGRQRLKYLDLQDNRRVKGVRELLELIPGGFDLDRIREFYEKTGLRLRVTHYNDQYEVQYYDRNGVYPRPFLNIYGPIMQAIPPERVAAHSEWFEPQEACDLELRYIDSIDENLKAM